MRVNTDGEAHQAWGSRRTSARDRCRHLAVPRAFGLTRFARWEAHNRGPDPNTAEGRMLTVMDDIRQRATRIWGKDDGRSWLHDYVVALQARPLDVLIARGPVPVHQTLMELWEGTS